MVETSNQETELITKLISKGILVSPDSKDKASELNERLFNSSNPILNPRLLYLNKDIFDFLRKEQEINFIEFEKIKANAEISQHEKKYKQFLGYLDNEKTTSENEQVKIISSFEEHSNEIGVRDFTLYFNSRLSSLQKILYSRDELRGVLSISRIIAKKERESVSLIGMVTDKHITKNNNIILTLEDSTGQIKVLVNKNKPEIYEPSKDIVPDEVIGISGVSGDNIVFANNVLWPDIPSINEMKKSENEAYALFLSDLHVGSKDFLGEDFDRFLKWINQETGNEKQKEIASKVKYIFIVGDLIDGVGIYPGQEGDLVIKGAGEQYEECARLLSMIPKHISLIICPGNHDSLRVAEPQPPLKPEFSQQIYNLPNAIVVSNPSLINIHSDKTFSGFNVLLYHGYSFDYYVANVDSIRNKGGYDRADLIMKFLLKRRHLAPTHTSTLYVPYTNMDPLIIDTVPDFFVTGHIHKSAVANYKNITLISGSCWQSKTEFQEKVGHHPEPSRVPIVNLSTREVKILRFGK
jgi:DNA polymerase II small subunit